MIFTLHTGVCVCARLFCHPTSNVECWCQWQNCWNRVISFFETEYENWMWLYVCVCLGYDSIELHLCKILMRYNFLIIPNAAHDTIVSSPSLFAVSLFACWIFNKMYKMKCDLITSELIHLSWTACRFIFFFVESQF